ncbi:SAM-dependent methyltransferase [Psychromonas sp. RZ22]|uniref:class I SAM-dependent methyltransferase n=1 Tax=Psychromonas algarum TaxID=2555643 RepID=UPI0010681607|nr:SAM-dependent methyltransferase [Psychromonas sp. RZ22]TEW54166.1 SAM-dependent methyltransferase [Psychromonas sp. RZ22]
MPHLALNDIEDFYLLLSKSLEDNSVIKLLLSKYRGEDKSLKRITIRPITLQNESVLSFVYEHQTNHITKNYTYSNALIEIKALVGDEFKSAYLTLIDAEVQIEFSKKGKLKISQHKAKQAQDVPATHNREKNRFVDIQRPFLSALKVTDKQQKLIPAMSNKWKQINKFIEVFSQALSVSPHDKKTPINVVDFGSGKGYLTFAIHDYLQHTLGNEAQVTGVELRQGLADLCNETAFRLGHRGLDFVCGDVKTHAPKKTDVMIALHACDIATDYAIHYGIRANASIIMCSPCCHKQIRPQMVSPELFQPMLQYGVHLGQEAEMVTDSLRAMLLEANGYTTKVFEFISLEHTNKNKMILAVKKSQTNPKEQAKILAQIANIKSYYSIEDHCLESLLNESAAQA